MNSRVIRMSDSDGDRTLDTARTLESGAKWPAEMMSMADTKFVECIRQGDGYNSDHDKIAAPRKAQRLCGMASTREGNRGDPYNGAAAASLGLSSSKFSAERNSITPGATKVI